MRVVDHADKNVQLFLCEFAEWLGEALHDLLNDGCPYLVVGQRVRCGVTDRPVSQRQFKTATARLR